MSCDNIWEPRPASSTEYVWAIITAEAADGSALDPTSDPVAMAFIPTTDTDGPQDDDFHDAIWRTIGTEYQAGCLVGPENDGVELDPGRYRVYVKVTDAPEVPIRRVEQTLHITPGGDQGS